MHQVDVTFPASLGNANGEKTGAPEAEEDEDMPGNIHYRFLPVILLGLF
jgi:hypothetical protein